MVSLDFRLALCSWGKFFYSCNIFFSANGREKERERDKWMCGWMSKYCHSLFGRFSVVDCHIFFGIKCLSYFIRLQFRFSSSLSLSLLSLFHFLCVCVFYSCACACVMFVPKVCFVCCHLENECKFGRSLIYYIKAPNQLNLTRWNLIF